MAENVKNKKGIRPSIAELHAVLTLKKLLPSADWKSIKKKYSKLKHRIKWEGFCKNLRQIEDFYGEKMTRDTSRDGATEEAKEAEVTLSRAGTVVFEYARAILKTHQEIQDWPPVFEIVVGATQRTASAYLPSLLDHFLKEFASSQNGLPFQLTIREIHSREEFFRAVENQEVDFGIRGLPPSEDEIRGTPISHFIEHTSFGPAYRLVAVSKQPFPSSSISVYEELCKKPIGVLKMNLDRVLAFLARTKNRISVPRKNIISCDSQTTLMSFVQNSLCPALVFVPPDVTSLEGLHTAELSDVQATSRCYVFVHQALLAQMRAVKFPRNPELWRRIHYLARLRDILWDPQKQLDSLKPKLQQFLFM